MLGAALLGLVVALVATRSIRGLVVGLALAAVSVAAAGYALRPDGEPEDEAARR